MGTAAADQPGQPAGGEGAVLKVLVCVTGSVAGVKTGELLTKLRAAGVAMQVAATAAGAVFIERTQQPLPQGVRVLRDADVAKEDGGDRFAELVQWADVLLVAPLSANSLAKLSMGLCDSLVTSVARAWPLHERPMLLAPAMNTKMWDHPVTKGQLAVLEGMGARVIPPVSKLLACGDVGNGAMASVGDIVADVLQCARAGSNGASTDS